MGGVWDIFESQVNKQHRDSHPFGCLGQSHYWLSWSVTVVTRCQSLCWFSLVLLVSHRGHSLSVTLLVLLVSHRGHSLSVTLLVFFVSYSAGYLCQPLCWFCWEVTLLVVLVCSQERIKVAWAHGSNWEGYLSLMRKGVGNVYIGDWGPKWLWPLALAQSALPFIRDCLFPS